MWQERARESHAVLVDEYWDHRTGLFRVGAAVPGRVRALMPWRPWHYWWQAHGLEVLLDAHEAGDRQAGQRAVRLIEGIAHRNRGDLTANRYYDDVAWMGLATLRAHRLGLIDVQTPSALADAVMGGWDVGLGGVRWRVGDEFRNVAATAPGAMLLAGISWLHGDAGRLGIARAAADWLHSTLVDPCGIVWDGCRPQDGVLVPEGRLWSYNVGTVAGLDVVLGGMADPVEARRLSARAARVVRAGSAALRAQCAEVSRAVALVAEGSATAIASGAVWRDELHDGAGADPQLFRGILARHAATLVLTDPTLIDVAHDLVVQGEAVWRARDGRGRISPSWAADRPVWSRERAPTLAAHLSGALALASLARLERAGLT